MIGTILDDNDEMRYFGAINPFIVSCAKDLTGLVRKAEKRYVEDFGDQLEHVH